MRSKEETERYIQNFISICTVSQDPKVPEHFFSAYIDGKLYRGPKGKTVWNRKCDVVNSLKYNTELFKFLRSNYEEELYETNPELFESTKFYWQQIPYPKSKHRQTVDSIVNLSVNAWWETHVEVREVQMLNEKNS